MAVRASIVVKSGLMRVGQKQMDKFSLVIKFTLLSWLTLGKTHKQKPVYSKGASKTDGCLSQKINKCIYMVQTGNLLVQVAHYIFENFIILPGELPQDILHGI